MREPAQGLDLSPAQEEAAERGLKGLIPVAGRPFLDHVLSALGDAGIREVCLVTGPGDHTLRSRYQGMPTSRLSFRFAVQEEPRGTAHALLQAREHTLGGDFLLINADNWYPPEAVERVMAAEGSALAGFTREGLTRRGNIPSERVNSYALVETDEEGGMRSVAEKPDPGEAARLGEEAWVSMTLWKFRPVIYEACEQVRPSRRGERELPEGVQIARDRFGETFRVVPCPDLGVLDLSYREDIPAVERHLDGREVVL